MLATLSSCAVSFGGSSRAPGPAGPPVGDPGSAGGTARPERPRCGDPGPRRPGLRGRRLRPVTDSPACREAMERAPLAGTQTREGGDAGAGPPEKGGDGRKADYLSGDAEPCSRLQPFPEKRKRRRRGERGGRERRRREVVAQGPRAGVLGRAPPVGERPGGPRRSPQPRRRGALPLWAPDSSSPVSASSPPQLFLLRAVAWKGEATPPGSGAGEGTLAGVRRPRRHK